MEALPRDPKRYRVTLPLEGGNVCRRVRLVVRDSDSGVVVAVETGGGDGGGAGGGEGTTAAPGGGLVPAVAAAPRG
jgi:hypothetical protein